MQQLQDKFNLEYKKLNQQQRLAVDTIEGPVMVIAGPGTGKTQILAARIGKILLETDTQPENIVCLTYTDAGTIAMRKRLVQFIGVDAYKINIFTFHSFCNDVIQDNLHLFEKSSLDAISELETIELYKKLINSFSKNNPLKRYRGDVYFEINNLKNLFSTIKKEGWTPLFINSKIDEYLTNLKDDDSFEYKTNRFDKYKKGDKKPIYYEEIERLEKLRAAVNEFENYQHLMQKNNRYDFDDMINWVIKVFEENPTLLSNYQEKFQYILVDEYQDTSGTQNKLVQLLINFWSNPNIFVVGDDDQSIYRFQGANVENMLDFANEYSKSLLTIVLTNNYRSTQPILNIAKTIIDKNQERLVNKIEGLNKNLTASNTLINQLTNTPIINEYNSIKEEMIGVANQVFSLLQQNVLPGKIAIIFKENKYGEVLSQYLRLKSIPIYSKRKINIIEHPFIKKILQILRYINAEHDIPYGGDEMLFEILHYDFYKIQPIKIAQLTLQANKSKYGGEISSLRKILFDKANVMPKDLFDTGYDNSLKNISHIIEQLIADVSNVTLQQLFANIIKNAGVINYVLNSPDKIKYLQLLTSLFDFIKEETCRNPLLNLNNLISIMDLMEKEKLPIKLNQIAGNDKGVNLLTAHGSKGLEFEYVFFVGLNSNSWEKKKAPNNGYKIPNNLFSSQPTGSDEEELRRVFYVAITRAEKYLTLSYAKLKNDAKEIEPSMFIVEIVQQHNLSINNINLTDEEMMEFAILEFENLAPEIEKPEEDFINSILDKFVMNVTALNNYLDCPLSFYYKNLIRIPTGKSEATEFGSAIHYALEKLFRKMQDGKQEKFAAIEDVLNDFNWYMHRHREHFTKEAFDRRIEYGCEVLQKYYDKYIFSWNKVVAVERNIRGVIVNGVPLKGKLDKLEFDGKNVNVVDYKSGDIDKAKDKLKPPNDKNPNGGSYWRQAVFYKILIDNYNQKDWKVISTEFDFVEPDKKKEYRKEKIVITNEDIETVKQQLTMVWQKIQNKEFYIGCGKETCHWCNFVKENHLATALHELQEIED